MIDQFGCNVLAFSRLLSSIRMVIGWFEASGKLLGQDFNLEQYSAKFQLTRITSEMFWRKLF